MFLNLWNEKRRIICSQVFECCPICLRSSSSWEIHLDPDLDPVDPHLYPVDPDQQKRVDLRQRKRSDPKVAKLSPEHSNRPYEQQAEANDVFLEKHFDVLNTFSSLTLFK